MIAAVKHHRLYTINSDIIAQNGPRLLQGAAQVCTWLNPQFIK